jgi:hypothetical protein
MNQNAIIKESATGGAFFLTSLLVELVEKFLTLR